MPSTPWGRRREARQTALAQAIATEVVKAAPNGRVAAATRGSTQVDTAGIITDTTGMAQAPTGQYMDLPRDMGTFGGAFGPGVPLRPAQIDPLRADGRPDPRISQYDPARNLNLNDRLVPFTVLRSMADQCDVVRRCVQIRKAGITGLAWSFTLSRDAIRQIMADTGETNSARAAIVGRAQLQGEIDRMNAFWETPDRLNSYSWSEWWDSFLEEHFVLDAVPVYPHMDLGGRLHSLEVLDGSTIKPLLDRRGARPNPPSPAFQQILWGFPRGEFQESDSPDDEFAFDQLFYAVRTRRTFSPYGLSLVEQSLPAAALWLERQAWLRSEYVDSSLPKSVAKITNGSPAENWTPDQRVQWQVALNDELSGQTGARHRMLLLPPGIELEDTPELDEKYKPEYDEFLIKRIGSVWGVSPSVLGIIPRTGIGGKGQQEGEQDQAEMVSQAPDLEWLIDVANEISARFLGMPRTLTLQFDDGGTARHQVDEANVSKTLIATGVRTINDNRADAGLPLFDMPEADEPMIITAQGPVFLRGTLDAQLNPPTPAPLPPAPAGAPPVAPVDAAAPVVDEAKKFATYARNRTGRTWRDFQFELLPGPIGKTLNHYGRSGDRAAIQRIIDDLGKGKARQRPGHAIESQLLDGYVESVRAALAAMFDPATLTDRIFAHVGAVKADTGGGLEDQIGRLIGNEAASTDQLLSILRSLISDSYVAGRAIGGKQISDAGVTITSTLDVTVSEIDWSGFVPGDAAAAAKLALADGSTGLAGMLDAAGITIKGIQTTTVDRISVALAAAFTAGDSTTTAASAVNAVLDDPARAYTIAQTEMTRAVSGATLDSYGSNGVEQKEWLTIDGGCDLCGDAESEGPIGLDANFDSVDTDAPPGHPNCLCTLLPVVGENPDPGTTEE